MKPAVTTDRFPVACFAPPLTDAKLAAYQSAADALPAGPVRDAVRTLLAPVAQWWELPESRLTDDARYAIKHQGKPATFAVTSLEKHHQAALFDAIPWDYELDAIQGLFDRIPVEDKTLRDMAFHLLWHARELCNDREPLTADKLGGA